MQTARSALPLSGVKVVDFGQYIAGPAVAMILGDLGATVVHVDPPGGPLWDSPANATLHRNKLIVRIDLKTPEGLAQAHTLVAQADIVIENFRPGVLSRLGIDFADLRTARPQLITVSIPGFAPNDRLRRDWRAFEWVIAAASGQFTDMGINRVLMGAAPYFSPLALTSAYGTMFAASAAVLALQARERSGVGDAIEVPLACAVMEGLAYNSIDMENVPDRYKGRRGLELARRREAGLPLDMSYESLQEIIEPFVRNYRCKDGRGFYVVCPGHKQHQKRCYEILGLYDQLVAEGLAEEGNPYLPHREWPSKALLGASPWPEGWQEKVVARMEKVFLTRTAKEWERIFRERNVPGAAQQTLREWMHDDHARAAGLVVEVDDPVYGRMLQPGPMAWLEESADVMAKPSPREEGTVRDALAVFSAIPPRRLAAPAAEAPKGWLAGVRILDMANIIAGPHSTSYLARFGAEIIKLDPVVPVQDTWVIGYGLITLRGKRSILVDIRTPAGREIFERLVKSVDIVVWNATDSQVARMGLDAKSLEAINPQAIFCKLDLFGGPRRGPRSDCLGYDDLAQVASGIMARFGGSVEKPEEHAHVGTVDALCGYAAAVAMAAALYQRASTGRAGRARTSLAAVTGLLQMPFFYDYEGRGPFDEPAGPSARGYDALTHLYLARCGRTLMLSASERDLPRFGRVAGLEGLADVPEGDRTSFLSRAFSKAPADEWIARLHAADIGAAICESMHAIRQATSRPADDDAGIGRGSFSFSTVRDHPSGHAVTMVDQSAVRPAVGKILSLPAAEKFGKSTREVLRSFGYGDAEIDALLDSGAIGESWSREYLPT